MLNELVQHSNKLAEEHRKDPAFAARMELASQGQFPKYLLISPITHSSQDLQVFNMNMGDAFRATRIPGHALPTPKLSPFLFQGPASYNHDFPDQKGVIVTFEKEESLEIIRETIDNICLHPDLQGLPIIAFQVDYQTGRVRLIVHSKGRSYEYENRLLAHIRRPDQVDNDTLVLICSDSRVCPPITTHGHPLSIQTLGGYIPAFTEKPDETEQLNEFFEKWVSSTDNPKQIVIVAHGNFEGEGPSCGAGIGSLDPARIRNPSLKLVMEELNRAARDHETHPPESPEERVITLSKVTRAHLLTYPAIADAHSVFQLAIDELVMDTVTNTLHQLDDS